MPKTIKFAIGFLITSLCWVAFAHAADAPSLAEHSDALVWIIVGLVTVINGWAAATWKDIKTAIKELTKELENVRERVAAVEAACRVRHEEGD